MGLFRRHQQRQIEAAMEAAQAEQEREAAIARERLLRDARAATRDAIRDDDRRPS